jgi:hypothetical protein
VGHRLTEGGTVEKREILGSIEGLLRTFDALRAREVLDWLRGIKGALERDIKAEAKPDDDRLEALGGTLSIESLQAEVDTLKAELAGATAGVEKVVAERDHYSGRYHELAAAWAEHLGQEVRPGLKWPEAIAIADVAETLRSLRAKIKRQRQIIAQHTDVQRQQQTDCLEHHGMLERFEHAIGCDLLDPVLGALRVAEAEIGRLANIADLLKLDRDRLHAEAEKLRFAAQKARESDPGRPFSPDERLTNLQGRIHDLEDRAARHDRLIARHAPRPSNGNVLSEALNLIDGD